MGKQLANKVTISAKAEEQIYLSKSECNNLIGIIKKKEEDSFKSELTRRESNIEEGKKFRTEEKNKDIVHKMRTHTIRSEGGIRWLYLDTNRYITIGIGHCLGFGSGGLWEDKAVNTVIQELKNKIKKNNLNEDSKFKNPLTPDEIDSFLSISYDQLASIYSNCKQACFAFLDLLLRSPFYTELTNQPAKITFGKAEQGTRQVTRRINKEKKKEAKVAKVNLGDCITSISKAEYEEAIFRAYNQLFGVAIKSKAANLSLQSYTSGCYFTPKNEEEITLYDLIYPPELVMRWAPGSFIQPPVDRVKQNNCSVTRFMPEYEKPNWNFVKQQSLHHFNGLLRDDKKISNIKANNSNRNSNHIVIPITDIKNLSDEDFDYILGQTIKRYPKFEDFLPEAQRALFDLTYTGVENSYKDIHTRVSNSDWKGLSELDFKAIRPKSDKSRNEEINKLFKSCI